MKNNNIITIGSILFGLNIVVILYILNTIVELFKFKPESLIAASARVDAIALNFIILGLLVFSLYNIYETIYNILWKRDKARKTRNKITDSIENLIKRTDKTPEHSIKHDEPFVRKDKEPAPFNNEYLKSILNVPMSKLELQFINELNGWIRTKPVNDRNRPLEWYYGVIWSWYNTATDKMKEVISIDAIYKWEFKSGKASVVEHTNAIPNAAYGFMNVKRDDLSGVEDKLGTSTVDVQVKLALDKLPMMKDYINMSTFNVAVGAWYSALPEHVREVINVDDYMCPRVRD